MPDTIQDTTPGMTPGTTPDLNAEHDRTAIHLIPLAEIDDTALSRDRVVMDAAGLDELRASIAANGLRMPIEVYRKPDPEPEADRPATPRPRYGLISGYRRLGAFRGLLDLSGQKRYRAIPAFLRAPGSMAEALAAMVEENEVREGLSPWERGRIALTAHESGAFPSIDEAVAKLYAAANRYKRARLRTIAYVVQELDTHLTEPETLSQQQIMRLTAALQSGFGEIIRTALEETSLEHPAAEWKLIAPILAEAEQQRTEEPDPRPAARAALCACTQASPSAARRPAMDIVCTSRASVWRATLSTTCSERLSGGIGWCERGFTRAPFSLVLFRQSAHF